MSPTIPTLTSERLILRGWRPDDVDPYAQMMADSETARFITRNGQPLGRAQVWSEVAYFIGHWQLLGHGFFVVEDKESGAFLGRIGTLAPEGWPGVEIAWGLDRRAHGKGYGREAALAAIDWAFSQLPVERLISIIHPDNLASQKLAARVGEHKTRESFTPFREACDIWALNRSDWERCSRLET